MRSTWQEHVAAAKDRALSHQLEHDVRRAEKNAASAEQYALDAVDFALAAIDEVICPEAVRTPILEAAPYLLGNAITVAQAADTVYRGVTDERFMIVTHPTTLPRFQEKAADYERYIAKLRMRRRDIGHA